MRAGVGGNEESVHHLKVDRLADAGDLNRVHEGERGRALCRKVGDLGESLWR